MVTRNRVSEIMRNKNACKTELLLEGIRVGRMGSVDLAVSGFDVSCDESRFLMTHRLDKPVSDQIIVVDNWFEELKRQSTTSRQ